MNDMLVPEFIRQMEAEEKRRSVEIDAGREAEMRAAAVIALEGPEFFRQFLKEVALAVESLSRIGLTGSLSPIYIPEHGEQLYRVTVARIGSISKHRFVDIYFHLEAGTFRCFPQEGAPYHFSLSLQAEGSVRAVGQDQYAGMRATELSAFIVKGLICVVRR